MSREILVVTPENIEIEYELAGIGSRFLANILDSLFQLAIYLGVWIVVGIIAGVLALTGSAFSVMLGAFFGEVAIGFALIAAFTILWGYFIWFETRWKRPDARQAADWAAGHPGRRLPRSISLPRLSATWSDSWTGCRLWRWAWWQAACSGISRGWPRWAACAFCFRCCACWCRAGISASATLWREPWWSSSVRPACRPWKPSPRRPASCRSIWAPYALADIGRHVYEMTVPEYRAVRHYIDRRWQLPPQIQQTVAMRLAVPLMQRLGIVPPSGVTSVNYADFLEYLAVAFEQYRGVK